MSAALDWLDAREPAPPPALRACMAEALTASPRLPVPPSDVAEELAEAALECLRAALRSDGGRGAALDVLAADALLTYACEAAAETSAERILEITRAYGPARLARLVDTTTP